MRAKRAKYIRRVFKQDYKTGETSQRYITYPEVLTLPKDERAIRYSFQYINEGFKRVVQLAKDYYKKTGRLPR